MKEALVTGSTKGIGFAIAKELIENDYHVFINGRYEIDKIELPQGHNTYLEADLSNLDGVTSLAKTIIAQSKKLDCIVLNAGSTCRKPLKDICYSDWQYVMDMNVIPHCRNIYQGSSRSV